MKENRINIGGNSSKIVYIHVAMMLLLAILSGCAQQRKVLTTWQGRVISEKRLNEKVKLGTPVLDKVDWGNKAGTLQIYFRQNSESLFDLKRQYEKNIAVRSISKEQANKLNALTAGDTALYTIAMPLSAVFAGGYGAPELVDGKSKEAKARSMAEETAVSRLKKGESLVKLDMVYSGGMSNAPLSVHTEYRREVIGEYIEIMPNQSAQESVAAVGVQVRLQGFSPSVIENTVFTDKLGCAYFTFAKKPSEAMNLKPMLLKIEALWNGSWYEIGTAELSEQEIKRIAMELNSQSIIASGVPKLPPFAKVFMKMPTAEIKPDTDCELLLTVENTGKGEFYQLVATSESLISALDGIKFEFGKLNPGETLTLSQKAHIPREHPTGPAVVNFKWSELNGYQPDPVQAKIMVKGLPRPQFAISTQVLDDNTGNSVGNGDGRIQGGEAVDLLVTVKNIGDGAAKETTVKLDEIDIAGVIVNVKEQKVGEIAVGESKTARLTITTKKASNVVKLSPTVQVIDSYLNVEQKEQLSFALESELAPSIMAYQSTVYVDKQEVAVRGGAGSETAIIARAKPGTSLQATGELAEWIRVELPNIGTGWVRRSEVAFEPTKQAVALSRTSGGVVEILQKAPPLVAIAKPLSESKFLVSQIEVSGVIVDDQAVSRTQFVVNGKEVQLTANRAIGIESAGTNAAQREVNFTFPANLSLGENEIEIIAWDNEGLKSSKVLTVSYEKEKGNVYLACIGIDEYKSVPRLKYASADAQAMMDGLRKSLGVPEENSYILLNDQATLTNIKNTLGVKIQQRAGKSDTVIIYFSGHGAPEADPHSPDADGVNKYLLPIDAERNALYATALPMDEVRNIFRRLICDRVIFIADTCYSGAAGGRTLMPEGTQYRSVNQDNLLTRLCDTGKGRVILTASQGSEVSQEMDKLGHGVFTYYLLHGLNGKADQDSDQAITVSELYQYVSKEVSKETNNTQHPMMKMDEMVGQVVIGVVKGR